jgi:T5SS/PEP-CTERM-associated repeat protein
VAGNTFTWFGGSGSGDVPGNWTPAGPPNSGDTAIVNSGTVQLLDAQLNSNTVFLNAGTFQLTNDTGSFYSGGSLVSAFDSTTTLFAGASGAAEIDTFGDFVNDGLIKAAGTAHTSTTIQIAQNGTAPGFFINYGEIEAAAGNSVTIEVAGTSELFNADLIYANGGKVVIDGNAAGVAGGYAPMLGGIALIGDGGTIEFNAGFPSGTEGSSPAFAFNDGDSGDTLKLDQVAQFGGRILGFQQGDTIDLGQAFNVGSIVVTNDGQLLLENHAGNVLASLVMSSGAFNPGTFAVTLVSAGTFEANGITLTAGADGNTLLTTNLVNSVWNNTSGTWQTAADWSTGVAPGALASAFIGDNVTGGADGTIAPFTITTGTTGVDVNSLSEVNQNATLQITSDTAVGAGANLYGLQQVAGKIEITGGNTLTVSDLKQDSPATDLQIDAGGVLAINGHSNLGFANNGTLSEVSVVNGTTFANGNTIGLFVTGTATVNGGAIDAGPVFSGTNLVSTGGLIDIGLDGGGTPSTMTVQNGATVIDTYADLSSNPTSFGELTLTGSGTTWDNASDPTDAYNTRGYLLVGNDNQTDNQPSPPPAGTAQLVVENDARLNDATYAEIGNTADSAGSATIASGGVWNIGTSSQGGFMNVGDRGSGTLDIDGGTVNILPGSTTAAGGFPAAGTFTSDGITTGGNGGMGIAHHVGSDGTVFVSGSGQLNIDINATVDTGFGVGQNGHGVLDIFDKGTVSITNGGISAGSTLGGDGTIIVGSGDGQGALLVDVGDALSSGLGIGRQGTGTLDVNAGGTVQVSGGGIGVGSSAGAFGLVQINGGLLEDTTNGLTIGEGGVGTVVLTNSGTISLNGGGIGVGLSAGAQGLLEISSGGLVTSTTNGANIGEDTGATGTLEILAGGIYNISTHGISDGLDAGATGTILVDGTGALLNVSTTDTGFALAIGQNGTGFLTVESNGSFAAGNANLDVGQNAGSTGTVVVGSGGQISTDGAAGINVGDLGSGLLTIGSGGTVSAGNFFDIAPNGAASGVVIVNGGTLDDKGFFSVGGAGSGTLLVGGHGLVDQTGLDMTIGASSGGNGTVDVNNATLDTQGVLAVGGAGFGEMTVSGAGVVNDGTGEVGIGYQSTGTGNVDVSAGTLLAGGMQVGGFGDGTLTVENQGQVVLNGGTASGLGVGASVGGFGTGVVDINNGTISETGGGVTVGSVDESGFLQIGSLGVLITTGTASTSGPPIPPTAGEIGATGFGLGAINVLGGTWIANGQIVVAASNAGALDISDGGLVNAGTNTVAVGNGSGGLGTITVAGGTLLAGSLQIAEPFSGTASGIVTIAAGSTVDTGSLSEGVGGAVTVGGSLAVTGSSGISISQSGNGPSALTVSSGGTVTNAGFLTVGSGGAGSLEVLSGGVVDQTVGGTFVLGLNSAGAGSVTVDGGDIDGGSGNLIVGSVSGSTGVLVVESGGTLSAGGVTDGNSGAGSVTATGPGSTLTAAGEATFGGSAGGSGSLLVENHASVITGGSSVFTGFDVGTQANASGEATVAGAGSLLDNTGQFIVGDDGLGSLSIQSGATVIAAPSEIVAQNEAVIANQSAAGGSSVNVTGVGSDWQVGGPLAVGNAATGVLAITNGASVTATTLDVGVDASGAGVVTVSGPGADLTTTGTVTVGDSGSGELSILDGANATIGGDLDVANAGSGTGNVDIEDTTGTITFGGNILVGFNGFGVFNVGFGVDYIQNNGGIIFGPDSSGAINSFADPSPFLSNSSPSPISIGAQGVDQLAAYLFNSGEFTIPNNHSLTFDTPIISGGGSFALGSGDSLVLNADTVTGQTFTLGSNDKLTIGIDQLATIDLPASGTGPFTPETNPNKGDLLVGNFAGIIANFTSGDTIDVDTYLSSAAAGTLSQNGSLVSVIEIANGDTLGVLRFDTAANATAAIADDAITLVPCFAAGTRISTERGEVAVEAIEVGDRVRVLLGDGFSEVIWVGRREVDCAAHPTPRKVWPVRVAAGAFGPGRPHSDVWLSPDHAVFVNQVLIPIRHLINGSSIVQVPVERATYHHVELAEHDVLLAEGLPAESFLDMRDGTKYSNRSGPVRLYPDFSARMWEAFGCARLVVTGPELAAARAFVAGFAAERVAA